MASTTRQRRSFGSLPRTIFADEHDEFRASACGFLLREGAPHAAAWEAAGIIDRDFWRKAANQGFVGFAASGPIDVPVPVEDAAQFADVFGADATLAWDAARGEPAGAL